VGSLAIPGFYVYPVYWFIPSGNYRGGNNLKNNLVCIGMALARNSMQEGMGK